jgi:hypothetical protein
VMVKTSGVLEHAGFDRPDCSSTPEVFTITGQVRHAWKIAHQHRAKPKIAHCFEP